MTSRTPAIIKIKISKGLQSRIRKGYPWVHFYQMRNKDLTPDTAACGDLGVVYDRDNRFLAIGLYDPFSDIRLRILNVREPVKLDAAFFQERIRRSMQIRAPLAERQTTGYRLINGENDGLPGLVLDLYGDTAVLKLYTSAWFPHLDLFIESLRGMVSAERGVLLLSRHVQRTLPGGISHENGETLFGTPPGPRVRFQENGLWFEADVLQGQKTGFFLDQRENRERIGKLSRDRDVLNAFSYTGGFSVYAFAGGARRVTELDSNPHAIAEAERNLRLNFPDLPAANHRQICGDAFEKFAEMEKSRETFDVVVLDPPAFARNKAHKRNALLAYTRLAKAGAKRTRPGGILFSASCSAPVAPWEFYRAVEMGIRATGRKHEEIERTGHPIDHPVTFRDGSYLKGIYYKMG